MSPMELILVLATLLCALIAGFVFAFATVVMPGIGKLGDREYIRAFQVIDGVIQAGQPVFGLAWLGSAAALPAWGTGGRSSSVFAGSRGPGSRVATGLVCGKSVPASRCIVGAGDSPQQLHRRSRQVSA